jgi:hypothetical protein
MVFYPSLLFIHLFIAVIGRELRNAGDGMLPWLERWLGRSHK